MGAYLSQPITDKESSDGEDVRFKYGTTAMQGWRTNMEVRRRRGTPLLPRFFPIWVSSCTLQKPCSLISSSSIPASLPAAQDAHATVLGLDEDTSFFGVYDGHGGKEVRRGVYLFTIRVSCLFPRTAFESHVCFSFFPSRCEVKSSFKMETIVRDHDRYRVRVTLTTRRGQTTRYPGPRATAPEDPVRRASKRLGSRKVQCSHLFPRAVRHWTRSVLVASFGFCAASCIIMTDVSRLAPLLRALFRWPSTSPGTFTRCSSRLKHSRKGTFLRA